LKATSLGHLPTWGCADLLRTKELSGFCFFSLAFFCNPHTSTKKLNKNKYKNSTHAPQKHLKTTKSPLYSATSPAAVIEELPHR
jgi:hypothetical protein